MFLLDGAKPNKTIEHDPERILKRFYEGRRPSRPQKWSKILKIVQTILARVLEVSDLV